MIRHLVGMLPGERESRYSLQCPHLSIDQLVPWKEGMSSYREDRVAGHSFRRESSARREILNFAVVPGYPFKSEVVPSVIL